MRTRVIENDFYERFAEVFDRIASLDPPVDLVIHSGDLYDSPSEENPSQPPVVAQETALSVLKSFTEKTGIPVLIIEGNHGLYRSMDVSLLDSLRMSISGLSVATHVDLKRALNKKQPLKYSYDKVDVFCFPYMSASLLESSGLVAEYNDWIMTNQSPSSRKPSVAVVHGMDSDRTLPLSVLSMGYSYIALGHDHKLHKHSENAWYAGSTERWRFDEAGQKKGFLVVEVSAGGPPSVTPEYIQFTRPVFNRRMTTEDIGSSDSLIERIETWFSEKGMKATWDSKTAARVRFDFRGSSRVGNLDIINAMESYRTKVLQQGSEYNIAQLTWHTGLLKSEEGLASYPEIESEYLIENPEDDFRTYLGTVKGIDAHFDSALLTKVAVRALKMSVKRSEEKLTLETLSEVEEK
jgi:DNA repair exonuclease SbcCD nuclease subunit